MEGAGEDGPDVTVELSRSEAINPLWRCVGAQGCRLGPRHSPFTRSAALSGKHCGVDTYPCSIPYNLSRFLWR